MTLPPTIEPLKSLTDLNLESVGLKNIPRELSRLVTLRRLDLTGNDFSAVIVAGMSYKSLRI